MISAIETKSAPTPNGHYSQGVVTREPLLFTSIQLPIVPGHSGSSPQETREQARQVLANISAILRSGGSSLDHVVRVTFYVTSLAHWPTVDEIAREYFTRVPPARGVVCVPELHLGYSVAADAVATVP